MNLGITGSRDQPTLHQAIAAYDYLRLYRPTQLHHGDCVGADVSVAVIADDLGIDTVSHPPTNESLRAFHESTVIRPRRLYLDRNRDIVESTDRLIALPDGPERAKSGTWFTVRYAVRVGKPVTIIYPDGGVETR